MIQDSYNKDHLHSNPDHPGKNPDRLRSIPDFLHNTSDLDYYSLNMDYPVPGAAEMVPVNRMRGATPRSIWEGMKSEGIDL